MLTITGAIVALVVAPSPVETQKQVLTSGTARKTSSKTPKPAEVQKTTSNTVSSEAPASNELPPLTREHVAELINATDDKIWQGNPATPKQLHRYSWVDFRDGHGHTLNVFEAFYTDQFGAILSCFTFDENQTPTRVIFNGIRTLDDYKFEYQGAPFEGEEGGLTQ